MYNEVISPEQGENCSYQQLDALYEETQRWDIFI